MRPEAAAGARDERGHVCHCPADGSRRPSPQPREPESLAPWRPWTLTPRDAELTTSGSPLEPAGDQQASGSKGAFGFQHPVRLYLPISKRQEYLQSSGEKVLASFPVQATIHFYNDASDSEEEEEEESQASDLQCQDAEQAESGPGAEGREQLIPPGRGSGGLGGKGPLAHGHCPGSTERSSSK
ncbi:Protein ripply3 [Manis javanica]|nr:Protein ripply3 [Manis javanica]